MKQQPFALVTNASQFAGPAAVQALVRAGYRVLVQDPVFATQAGFAAFCEEVVPAHQHAVHAVKGTEPEQWLAPCADAGSALTVVVSNDVYPALQLPIAAVSLHQLEQTLAALVVAPFRLLQAVQPLMSAQGRGSIIMITSCRTELPQPGGALPDLARAAANALMRSAAIELAPFGVAVNAIAPNFYYSEAYYPRARFIDDPAGAAFVAAQVPAGRLGQPEELADLIVYLAGLRGAFHTGSEIKFAGGWPMGPRRPV